MALSNMIFKNSLGTIELTRIMYSINHKYKWQDDGSVKISVDITVNGTVRTPEDDIGIVHGKGDIGTLELPNGVYNNIKLVNLIYENGIWAPWGKVSISFSDENEDSENNFEIAFLSNGFEYTLYNPTIAVNPSVIKRGDRAIRDVNGWVRHQLGHGMVSINVTGSVKTDPCELPDGLIEALAPRSEDITMSSYDYPKVCKLSEYFPAASGHLDINQVMITDAKIIWYFEDKYADLQISLIAPPQIVDHEEEE